MAETPLPPGIVPQLKEKPLSFFRTVDFAKRPKWKTSCTFAKEFQRIVGNAQEGANKNEYLARQLEKEYGKEDAIRILEQAGKHMRESIMRSSYKDTEFLQEYSDHARIARGILGTPNWKDPDTQPPPTQFSIR